MSELPITCYIRTLNEERRIGEVIEAARRVAVEVILVDSGSTDETLAIAETLGARVISQKWLGNGKQKRVGEQAAAHDWVLDLDADEVVSEELAREIGELFKDGLPRESGYWFRIVTVPPVGEVWEKCCVVTRVKLYDRRVFQIPDDEAWDQFEVGPDQAVGRLKGSLLHYSFRDVDHLAGKLNRVSSVRAAKKKLKPLWQLRLRIVFGFWIYLWRNIVWRGMWRGGLYSMSIAAVSAGGRWLSDVKMYERHRGLEKD